MKLFISCHSHVARLQNTRYSSSAGIVIVEVVLFEGFPIKLPEEQDLGSFRWIVTGSAGIGSCLKKYLEKFTVIT